MKSRKKRSRQTQTDETKRTSDERESGTGTMTSKQTDPPPAAANRHQSMPPPTRRAGEQVKASKSRRARERGQGGRKRKMKGHGEHEHLIISSPALSHIKQASHHTPARSPIQGTRTASRRHSVAITSWGKQPPQPYRIGAVPVVPLAILFEAAGTVRATEARQIDHGIAQHPKHGHAHAAA